MVTAMRFATAQCPEPERSQDRVFVTEHAAIVLDGASPFIPVNVPVGTYVDTLGEQIADALREDPAGSLGDVVAEAITTATSLLDLRPGASPSSTVSILRSTGDWVDLYALGDSAIYYGTGNSAQELKDSRLAALGIPEHNLYRQRLAEGHGYDGKHRELLKELQRQQRQRRNRPDGYWIAEADPHAALHASTRTLPGSEFAWAVLATDGAYAPMAHLALDDWSAVAAYTDAQLGKLLQQCAQWEAVSDPDGWKLPRSKVSDDKTLATVLFRR